MPVHGNATQIGDPVVLALFPTGGFAVAPYESQWRTHTVELHIRGRQALQCTETEKLITPLLIDKRDWMMSDQYVIDSELWRPLSLITLDSQGALFVVGYSFQVFAP
jgi:hypothetical protein